VDTLFISKLCKGISKYFFFVHYLESRWKQEDELFTSLAWSWRPNTLISYRTREWSKKCTPLQMD